MNDAQKSVIWIAAIVLVVMFTFPPWNYMGTNRNYGHQFVGYALITEGPNCGPYGSTSINLPVLVLQISCLALITVGLVLTMKSKR